MASYRDSFLAERGVAVATARAGNVIGGGDWAADRLMPDAVRAWQAGTPLRVRRPEAVRPWQHVLEPLAGYLVLWPSACMRTRSSPARTTSARDAGGSDGARGRDAGARRRSAAARRRWEHARSRTARGRLARARDAKSAQAPRRAPRWALAEAYRPSDALVPAAARRGQPRAQLCAEPTSRRSRLPRRADLMPRLEVLATSLRGVKRDRAAAARRRARFSDAPVLRRRAARSRLDQARRAGQSHRHGAPRHRPRHAFPAPTACRERSS